MPPSKVDGAALAHGLVRREHHGERADGILHVTAEVAAASDRIEHEGLLALAQRLVARLVGGGDEFVGDEKAPSGPITSFTKYAVSEIIGPQPTEPSSKII